MPSSPRCSPLLYSWTPLPTPHPSQEKIPTGSTSKIVYPESGHMLPPWPTPNFPCILAKASLTGFLLLPLVIYPSQSSQTVFLKHRTDPITSPVNTLQAPQAAPPPQHHTSPFSPWVSCSGALTSSMRDIPQGGRLGDLRCLSPGHLPFCRDLRAESLSFLLARASPFPCLDRPVHTVPLPHASHRLCLCSSLFSSTCVNLKRSRCLILTKIHTRRPLLFAFYR